MFRPRRRLFDSSTRLEALPTKPKQSKTTEYDIKYPVSRVIPNKQPVKIETTPKYIKDTTDAEGLDRAYASDTNLYLDPKGTLHVAGSKGSLISTDWIDNYTKMGIPLVEKMLGLPANYQLEQTTRYKQLDKFMENNPDKVKNLTGHSLGGAVVSTWMKNHPEFDGKARVYGTPYEDVLGKEAYKKQLDTFNLVRNMNYENNPWANPVDKWLEDKAVEKISNMMGLDDVKVDDRVTRIKNTGDPAAILDNSAKEYSHPDWYNHLTQGGAHDYHNIAPYYSGFDDNAQNDRPGNVDPNYTTLQMNTTAQEWTNQDGTISITQ